MLRRISTKLVVATLAAVVLPFVALSFYIDRWIEERLTKHVVQQALMGLARNLASQIDYFVDECHQDLDQWAGDGGTIDALAEYQTERGALRLARDNGSSTPRPVFGAEVLQRWSGGGMTAEEVEGKPLAVLGGRWYLSNELDRYVRLRGVYDLLIVVAPDGKLVTMSTLRPDGELHELPFIDYLFSLDFSAEPWFTEAMQGHFTTVDRHRSPYRVSFNPDASPTWNYDLGFAAPTIDPADSDAAVQGVLYGLVNWTYVQSILTSPLVKDTFRGLVPEEKEPSPYAWIWAADADTILAHQRPELYGQSVSRSLGLQQLVDAVRTSPTGWGLYPEYTFEGERKNAAFRRCAGPENGGLGWVVGVGINNDDIHAVQNEIRRLVLYGTLAVLALAVGWTFVIARRTTKPIEELQRTARRIAEGDLDAHIEITSKDELGALAEDFNRMTRELKTKQEALVKAEKDAAWKEMARQIAHDIKNPLTPIQLSLDLLERARRENAPGYADIQARTIELIRRQVEHLRHIAGEFYEFTGGRRPHLVAVDVDALVSEVLHLHDAMAVDRGVEVQRAGEGGVAWADLHKLRRVLVNLVTNALQAMPRGGALFVDTDRTASEVVVTIRDTGPGLSEEAEQRLFEPHFTTKSEGTGLGLAISKRTIEEMGGTIELASTRAPLPGGTTATLHLPRPSPSTSAALG